VFDTWPAGKQEVPKTITTHIRSVNRSITVVKKNVKKLPYVAHMTSSKSVLEPTSVHFNLESMFPGVNPSNHLLYLVDSAASHNFVRAEDMGRVSNLRPKVVYIATSSNKKALHSSHAGTITGGMPVLVVDGLRRNLLSVGVLSRHGFEVHLTGAILCISNRSIKFMAKVCHDKSSNLFMVAWPSHEVRANPFSAFQTSAVPSNKAICYHRRFKIDT